MENINYYKIIFYVPEKDLEKVKNAMFAAGAGTQGNYAEVCWQTLGTGQFRPLPGSDPAIGSENNLTKVQEYKVEMICTAKNINPAIEALKRSHPYEEPGYDVFQLNQY